MTTLPRRRRPRPTCHRVRPHLVRLDDRSVPAILWVTNTSDSGTGTLREALALANDGDEVRFDNSLTDQAIELTSGQLTVEDNITITGLGADHLAVERVHRNPDGSLNPAFRIFEVLPNRTVSITDLTVRNGLLGQVAVTDAWVSNGAGGGIYNHEFANLSIADSLISGNTVESSPLFDMTAYAQGGGLQNDGTAVVTNSTIQNNTAVGGNWVYDGPHVSAGGAGISNWGDLTLTRVAVTGNLVGAQADPFPDPPPEPLGSVSSSASGGGISSAYLTQLTLSGVVLYGNLASANSMDNSPIGTSAGGALAIDGQATITDSLIDINYAHHGPKVGRAGFAIGAGVYVGPDAQLTMTRTAVTNNHANADRSRGGGLYVLGTADLTNTTVSTNLASWVVLPPRRFFNQYGGGIAVFGDGHVTLNFSTVVDNNATTYFPDGVPGNGEVEGGGLYVQPNSLATATLDSTIVARNQAGAGPAPFMDHPDTPGQDVFGTVGSDGHNLIRNADESTGWVVTDLTGTTDVPLDPVLGPLADNGGPWLGYEPLHRRTLTHEVLNGSPALQAGNPGTAPATDQRGVDRDDAQPNIGAYEATLAQFLVETDPWNPVYSGWPFDVTVTAADPYGKTVYVYRGAIHFETTDPDPNVVVPDDYTFTAADAGKVTFYSGVTLWTPGPQRITVRDVDQPSIVGNLDVDVQGW
jgi:hypothetical protein